MLVRDALDQLQNAPPEALLMLKDAEHGDVLVTSITLQPDYQHEIPIGQWNPRGLVRPTVTMLHPTVVLDGDGSRDDVKAALQQLGRYIEDYRA